MTALTMKAPAKLNLGLAITGRRSDGFHSLVTIFQAIGISDTLEMRVPEHAPEPSWTHFSCSDPTLPPHDNLVVRAVEAVRNATGCTLPIEIRLRKTIPVAAGLGGASSNAGATLRGLNELWQLGLTTTELMPLGVGLGSDVPFFLRGGCALGQGRGEILRPLPTSDAWYVVVFPTTELPFTRKTAAMFGALEPGDFGTGEEIFAQASRLDAGMPLDPALLDNTFARPLYALLPALREVDVALRQAGAGQVAITGAGPAHYTAVETERDAIRIARAFKRVYAGDAGVFVCRSCSV
jgi:4-diphosphocytidyl-2-C-methyl-D-erythritol kinase